MNTYLYHHGILGQKWGIRRFQNPDGTLTEAGKKRYLTSRQIDQVRDTLDKSKYYDDVSREVFAITKADKTALKNAREELYQNVKEQQEINKQVKNIFKDLDRDKGTQIYYIATSEIASSGDLDDVNNMTLEDISRHAWRGVFDDGQQSIVNAYSMYGYKNGKQDELKRLYTKRNEIEDEHRKKAENYIQEALDEIGGENLSVYPANPKYTVAKAVTHHMINSYDAINSIDEYAYKLASSAYPFNDQHKSSIAKAEKIVSHIKNNKDASTWDLLNEAVENLGLSNKKAASLSQSDWNRINKEIADLKEDNWY